MRSLTPGERKRGRNAFVETLMADFSVSAAVRKPWLIVSACVQIRCLVRQLYELADGREASIRSKCWVIRLCYTIAFCQKHSILVLPSCEIQLKRSLFIQWQKMFFVDLLENASDCVASLFLCFPLSPGSLSPSTVRSHDARGGAVMLVARRICMVLHKMPAWLMTAWWAKHLFSPELQLYPFATQHKVPSCSSGCVEWNNVLISPLWTILYCGGFLHYILNAWPPTGFGWNSLFSETARRESFGGIINLDALHLQLTYNSYYSTFCRSTSQKSCEHLLAFTNHRWKCAWTHPLINGCCF